MSSGSSQEAHRDANEDDGWGRSFDGLLHSFSESMGNDLTCALFETIYDQHRIQAEARVAKRVVRKDYGRAIRSIKEMMQCQTRLTGYYLAKSVVMERIDEKYNRNMAIENTLANMPYRTQSILLLLENSFYGSANAIAR